MHNMVYTLPVCVKCHCISDFEGVLRSQGVPKSEEV